MRYIYGKAVVVTMALIGCAGNPSAHVSPADITVPPSSDVAVSARFSQRIYHLVICWLTSPGDPEARQKLVEASKQFAAIPGVMEVRVGTMLPSTRPSVDSTYDIGLVLVFDTEQSLRAYANNPIHIKASREILKPLTSHFVVYDFVEQ